MRSAKTAEKALRQMTALSVSAHDLEVEVKFLESQADGFSKTCDETTSSVMEKGREANMLECYIGLLKDELESLKRKDLIGCDMEVVSHKVADSKGKVSNFIDRLHRDSFNSYSNIRQNVDQTLLAVGIRLAKLIDREAKHLQESLHADFAMPGVVSRSCLAMPLGSRTAA